jgi:uncharacterized membrane protein
VNRSPWDSALGAAVVAACVWSALLVAAPMMGRSDAPGWSRGAAASAYLAGSLLCHQRPERSFHAGASQAPVCARCSGLYWSGTVGLLLAAMSVLTHGRERAAAHWRTHGRHLRWWLVAAATPTAITILAEWTGLWSPANDVRAMAAAPLGLVAGLLVGQTLSFRGKL